ncbi:MAG: hypothetical protein EOP34_05495 [Rickettsiales bacterium]|nr:MAG: hypothetical protein EOP34_05495 [Rickettsiales bacterium]
MPEVDTIEILKDRYNQIKNLEAKYDAMDVSEKISRGKDTIKIIRCIHSHCSLLTFNYKLKLASSTTNTNHRCTDECHVLSCCESFLYTILCILQKLEIKQRNATDPSPNVDSTTAPNTNSVNKQLNSLTSTIKTTAANLKNNLDNTTKNLPTEYIWGDRKKATVTQNNDNDELSLGLSNLTPADSRPFPVNSRPFPVNSRSKLFYGGNFSDSRNSSTYKDSSSTVEDFLSDELSDTELENLNTEQVDNMINGGATLGEVTDLIKAGVKSTFNKALDFIAPHKPNSELRSDSSLVSDSISLATDTTEKKITQQKPLFQEFKNELQSRLNMGNFTTLDNSKPTLVNFWSSNCGPSRRFIKQWDDFVSSYTDKRVNLIDIDCTSDTYTDENGKTQPFQNYLLDLSKNEKSKTKIEYYPIVLLYNKNKVVEMDRSKVESIKQFLDQELRN